MGRQEQVGLFADDSRGGHIAAGPQWPLQDMPVIVGDKDDLLSHIEKGGRKAVGVQTSWGVSRAL